MAKAKRRTKSIVNRRARYDYEVGDSFIVGLELTGAETKALRLGHGNLTGAYVTIKDNQLLLINANISGTSSVHINEEDQTRSRRLLAKRREIDQLIQSKHQGKTIIPLEILNQGRFIKLKIATATGKKRYDKRETLKKRSATRQIEARLKSNRRD
ncbi:MAG: SsrA-binding protein SmpB [Candidatus Saccharimonadales bacterium]